MSVRARTACPPPSFPLLPPSPSRQADHLLNFTAGGFVYVATVDVLPQLLRECSAWQTCKEVLAMCCGISLMVVVMEFE